MNETPDAITFTFENIIGKKIPKEQMDLQGKSYFEAFREGIPGGYRITFAKFKVGTINGKRQNVLWLDSLPPAELLTEGVSVTEVTFDGGDGKEIHGSYGLCDGRKFFVVGKQKALKRPGRAA